MSTPSDKTSKKGKRKSAAAEIPDSAVPEKKQKLEGTPAIAKKPKQKKADKAEDVAPKTPKSASDKKKATSSTKKPSDGSTSASKKSATTKSTPTPSSTHAKPHSAKSHRKPTTPFSSVVAQIQLSLPPCFIGNVNKGVNEYLDRFLMRYVEELDGVVLACSGVKAVEDSARLMYESPYLHFKVRVRFTLFKPIVGELVVGVVNKVSSDHIGLLVHGVFNASIPSGKIRLDEFKYFEEAGDGTTEEGHGGGVWRRASADGDPAISIGVGSVVRFTVAELVKANDMLTLVGSLIADPLHTGLIDAAGLAPAPLPELPAEAEEGEGDNWEEDPDAMQT
ncbi:uncharacterized protein EV422DRAFT_219076 [Fimicolochytrium jonesii]|uniref:uncharacterized protein n=1 Tax=Fimicolochytrium jonesii TaxID=1396493 RepID=UPI0022FE407F|nr:uncharacterized protein EV422DRAFT_219076 [Fimicolochytrium jonesii]KAI8817579.1 hypothetical protein EV422DRAFT_219076 [Fimicolochytrium jonesii]